MVRGITLKRLSFAGVSDVGVFRLSLVASSRSTAHWRALPPSSGTLILAAAAARRPGRVEGGCREGGDLVQPELLLRDPHHLRFPLPGEVGRFSPLRHSPALPCMLFRRRALGWRVQSVHAAHAFRPGFLGRWGGGGANGAGVGRQRTGHGDVTQAASRLLAAQQRRFGGFPGRPGFSAFAEYGLDAGVAGEVGVFGVHAGPGQVVVGADVGGGGEGALQLGVVVAGWQQMKRVHLPFRFLLQKLKLNVKHISVLLHTVTASTAEW